MIVECNGKKYNCVYRNKSDRFFIEVLIYPENMYKTSFLGKLFNLKVKPLFVTEGNEEQRREPVKVAFMSPKDMNWWFTTILMTQLKLAKDWEEYHTNTASLDS